LNELTPYIKPDGTIENIRLKEMLFKISKDYLDEYYNPLTDVLPFLNKYNIVNPYKRNNINLTKMSQRFLEIFKASNDIDSVVYMMNHQMDGLTENQKLNDLITAMVGGSETSAHTLVSAFYYMSKYPEVYQKLKDELNQNGFTSDIKSYENLTVETMGDLTYLNNFVKEVFRIDSAAPDTLDYAAYDNIVICGVPIAKGTTMKVDIHSAHFDGDAWLEPTKFEPDIHDTHSEFYAKSLTAGKAPDVYSRRTFSHGPRSCPGQSIANLEMKVFVSYFVPNMEIQFDQKDYDHEGIGFGMGSQFTPKVKVQKI
jgi:cytochrome P450